MEQLRDLGSFKLPERYVLAFQACASDFREKQRGRVKYPSASKMLQEMIERQAADIPSARKHLRGVEPVMERAAISG